MANTAPKLDVDQRRQRVAELNAKGLSERDIARALGVSRTTVWTDKQVLSAEKAGA